MRIECEQCRTRYAVDDERLRGRVYRFRCRRCGHSMLLQGDALDERGPDATAVEPRDFEARAAAAHAAAPDDDTGDDLFASRAAAVPDEEAFAPPERNLRGPSPDEARAPALTGARAETSMLFSLDNLKALATTPAPQPRANGHAPPPRESSGLIDIRALAARTLQATLPEPSGEAAPTFSVVPPLAMQPALAPMLMPVAERRAPAWALALGAGGALAGFAAIVLVAIVMHPPRDREAPVKPLVVAKAPTSPQAPPPFPADRTVALADPKGPATTTPATGTPDARSTAPIATNEKAHATSAPVGDSRERGNHDRRAARTAPATPRSDGAGAKDAPPPVAPRAVEPPAEKHNPPSRTRPDDDIGKLLEDATPGGGGGSNKPKATETTPSDANLPARLDMSDVKAGMAQAQTRANQCYAQYHVPGNALVDVTIAPSGRVEAARVGGALAGTPTGTCVERAVRSVAFKRFKGPAMSLQYPFMLR